MKFKHTFHVFVDNFQVIYKQLLYQLIVGLITFGLDAACVLPLINGVTSSQAFTGLINGVTEFFKNFIGGEFSDLPTISEGIKNAYGELITLFRSETGVIVLTVFLLLIVRIIKKWFTGLGNYATAAVINDKMSMRANSPYLATLIKNFKTASVYNAIYAPLSVLFDLAVCVIAFFLLYLLAILLNIPIIITIFLFTLIIVFAISLKMTFTTDWLPAIIRGKMRQKEALIYTFSRKNKDTLNILSNFVILILIIFSANVLATVSTLGVAALITIPASYVLILCFEMTNYFDREQIKYSIGVNSIIVPAKEHVPTREEFFRGEDE